eukprot:7600252-Ditylum_brightwellii.AAC.1
MMKMKEAESATENEYVPRVNVRANSKRHRYENTVKHTNVPQVNDVFEDGLFWDRELQFSASFSQKTTTGASVGPKSDEKENVIKSTRSPEVIAVFK